MEEGRQVLDSRFGEEGWAWDSWVRVSQHCWTVVLLTDLHPPGGVSSTLSLQGCMSSPAKTLLGGSKTIGIFSIKVLSEDEEENDQKPLDGGASASSLAWVLGLGLFLALCL